MSSYALTSTRVFVTCVNGTLVGFCAVTTPSRDEDAGEGTSEISALYVDPDHRRIGVGRALIATTVHDLAGYLWRNVTLWVLEASDRARSFYGRMGFASDGGLVRKPDEPPDVRLRRQLPVG